MSTVDRVAGDGLIESEPVPAGADSMAIGRAGQYLTDEVFLYRVVGLVAGEPGAIVELEDCYRLDVVRVPLAGLRARRLRLVASAPI